MRINVYFFVIPKAIVDSIEVIIVWLFYAGVSVVWYGETEISS